MKKLIITILFSLFVVQFSYSQDPIWTISAPTSNWFGTGNTERGLGFNPATGNLIVASRQGGVTPILIDAATGDSVGILKNKDVTFSENFEGISASGDAVTGWVFTNAQTWVLGGYGNNSDKYAGWGESSNTDHSIQSPLITDPGVLSFYIAGYSDATNTKVVVETSPDGTTWTSVDTLVTKGAGGDIGVSYIKKSYDLNKTGDYYIRWSTTEHVDGGFYLDDIEFHNPISGGTFAFNQIKASADGQIFTANLAINATSKIYRWANETAEPELVFEDSLGQRLGDSFGVVGEGDGVRVLLSGTGADKVEAFDWDGTELTHAATFPVGSSEARGGFSGHVIADSILISGTGTVPRFMNVTNGALGTQLASDEIEPTDLNSVMVNDQFVLNGNHYMAAGPAFTNGKFYMLDVTDPSNATLVHELGPIGANQNLNNTGGVVFDDATGRLYIMDTNNALHAYNISDFITQDFYLHDNGVTIVCTSAEVGESAKINGIKYTKRTKAQIQADHSLASTSCTSGITDMSGLFDAQENESLYTFNEDISHWDMSSVTTTKNMFHLAKAFNQDVSKWDVSNVTKMDGMFSSAEKFNQDLSGWNVSNVTDMTLMFSNAFDFNSPLDNWDVSKVTSMHNMFGSHFNQPIGSWDVSSVTDMSGMFQGSKFNQDISNWDVSNVTNMSHMFAWNDSFNQPIGGWDVSSVTDMSEMFFRASNFDQTLNFWDVSNVTEMAGMFNSASKFDQDISSWNVSKVVDMSSMFTNASSFNQPLNNWDVINVTNMDNMLGGSGIDIDNYSKILESWSGQSVQENVQLGAGDIQYYPHIQTFRDKLVNEYGWDITDGGQGSYFSLHDNGVTVLCKAAEIGDTGEINGVTYTKRTRDQITPENASTTCTSGITDMLYLFRDNARIQKFNADISHWDVSSVTRMQGMFMYAEFFNQDLNSWDVSNVTNMALMFDGASSFNSPLDRWNVSNVTDMSIMFHASGFNQDISNWDVSNVNNMHRMFHGSPFDKNINSWNVSMVKDMAYLFAQTNFNQPLNNWDVSQVKTMSHMFNQNRSFNQDISKWDVSGVNDMSGMFAEAVLFNQALNEWDLVSVSNLGGMFTHATSFNQPLNEWDVSNVTDMSVMFKGATSFNQPINSWDVSKVTNMHGMFMDTHSFNQPLDDWDVSNVGSFSETFRRSAFNQPLSEWNVNNGSEFFMMFLNNSFNQDISTWNFENANNITYLVTNHAFDATNYSKLLISWANQNLKDSLNHEINQNYFVEAQEARDYLINEKGWTINDVGPINNGILEVGESRTKQGFSTIIPVHVNNVQLLSDFYSVQFDLIVPKNVEFIGIDSASVRSSFTLQTNQVDSVIKFAIASDSLIPPNAKLLDLILKSDSVLSSPLTIHHALFNSTQVDSIQHGAIHVNPFVLGDLDDSGDITAYDAAVVLNRSVGNNILENQRPLPWENWRESGADVDKDGLILAMDATLILQKVVEIIDEFPDVVPATQDVIIEVTDRGLKFSAPESIKALNIILPKVDNIEIRDPEIYWSNSSSATHSNGNFDLAIASSKGTIGEVLELPLYVNTNDQVTFDVITYTNSTKKIHSVTVSGLTVNNETLGSSPTNYTLDQNYPNPFNPSTQIQYALPGAAQVSLEVFNAAGQKVATLVDTHQPAGYHTATFDASQLSSGVYLYKLTTPGFTQTKKMLLIK